VLQSLAPWSDEAAALGVAGVRGRGDGGVVHGLEQLLPGAGHRPAEDRGAAAQAWLGGGRLDLVELLGADLGLVDRIVRLRLALAGVVGRLITPVVVRVARLRPARALHVLAAV